jgi:putative hemolysin
LEDHLVFQIVFFQINSTLSILWVLLLLFCSAAVSSSEVALFSFSPEQRKRIEEADEKSPLFSIQKLTCLPNKEVATRSLLATILIVNNAVNIAIVILSTALMEEWFPVEQFSPITALFIHVVMVTFIIVMFGEVIPKIYATSNNLQVATWMARPLITLEVITRPISWFLIKAGHILQNRVKRKLNTISIDELGHALELTQNEMRSAEERRILEGIVSFGEKDVSQIMTPRTDLAMLSIHDALSIIIDKIKEGGFSRWLVYEDHIDQIKGILHIKDLIPYIHRGEWDWTGLITPAKFVPETKKIDDLLVEFRSDHKHMAIVVDEYGGVSGVVTLEDVIEEIIGDIHDEFDDDQLKYSIIDEQTYLFEGKISLIDFYRITQVDELPFEASKGDSSTLGGWIIEILGRVPGKGEVHKIISHSFTIEAGTNRKIDRVKVQLNLV